MNISFILAIAGVITIGICPLCGIYGVISSAVMSAKSKKGLCSFPNFLNGKNRQVLTAALISFVLTAIDIVLIIAFNQDLCNIINLLRLPVKQGAPDRGTTSLYTREDFLLQKNINFYKLIKNY